MMTQKTRATFSAPSSVHADASLQKRSFRVLLVDDHRDTLSILTRLLRSRGHAVDGVATGSEALAMLESRVYDVLVSDIGLPDLNGIDLMRAARSRGCQVKGIAISGFGMDSDIAASKEAGFFTHLVKPVDWQKLNAALTHCL